MFELLTEVTEGVGIRYLVETSEETNFLEKAISRFPVSVSLTNLEQEGDTANLIISRAHGEVVIRPYRCDIADIIPRLGIQPYSSADGLTVIKHEGTTYNILNERIFEN